MLIPLSISPDVVNVTESVIVQPLPWLLLSCPTKPIDVPIEIDTSAACADVATNAVPNAVNPTFFRLSILLPFMLCLILNRSYLSIISNNFV